MIKGGELVLMERQPQESGLKVGGSFGPIDAAEDVAVRGRGTRVLVEAPICFLRRTSDGPRTETRLGAAGACCQGSRAAASGTARSHRLPSVCSLPDPDPVASTLRYHRHQEDGSGR